MTDTPDPADVLRVMKAQNLVEPDCTVDQLPPAAWRFYADWSRTRAANQARQERRDAETAEWWASARAATAAVRAARARRDRIREWGRARGWPVGDRGHMPAALIEAYAVAEEGQDGQTGLF